MRGASAEDSNSRLEVVAVAALGLAILTNGPSVALSHYYGVPLGWERWPYLIPMGLVALVGVFLTGRSLEIRHLRRACWPLALLTGYLGWSITSVMWSAAPDATAVRSLLTLGVSFFGVWYGLTLSFKEQLLGLSISMASLTMWSLAVVLLRPHTHQTYPPPWHPGWHTTVFGISATRTASARSPLLPFCRRSASGGSSRILLPKYGQRRASLWGLF